MTEHITYVVREFRFLVCIQSKYPSVSALMISISAVDTGQDRLIAARICIGYPSFFFFVFVLALAIGWRALVIAIVLCCEVLSIKERSAAILLTLQVAYK